jgi:hypothetical protein
MAASSPSLWADPVTITLARRPVFNKVEGVIDGGGKVTLSGADKVRILYQNTCDQALHWTSSLRQQDAATRLQNLTFEHGRRSG